MEYQSVIPIKKQQKKLTFNMKSRIFYFYRSKVMVKSNLSTGAKKDFMKIDHFLI